MLIQVGVTGIRGPDGKIKENVPIYEEFEPTVAEKKEKKVCSELSTVFLEAFRKHKQEKRAYEEIQRERRHGRKEAFKKSNKKVVNE